MSKLRKILEENFRHNKAGLFSQDAPESEILKLEKIAIITLFISYVMDCTPVA